MNEVHLDNPPAHASLLDVRELERECLGVCMISRITGDTIKALKVKGPQRCHIIPLPLS